MTAPLDDLVGRLATAIVDEGVDHAVALVALARAIDRRTSTVDPPVAPDLVDLAALVGDRDPDVTSGAVRSLVDAVASHPGSGPQQLGRTHELLLAPDHRHRRGAFYTPPRLAAGVVREAFAALGEEADIDSMARTPTVCDPAVGGGAFLLAAADELVARGADPATVVERCLWGIDVDPVAVAVASAALEVWGRARGTAARPIHVVCADALAVGADAWPDPPVVGFTVVVGNPPFQNQLGADTARTPEGAAALRARWGSAVFRYTDTAALFLLAGSELAAPGGVVAMIVPVPMLVTDDADSVRQALLDRSTLVHLWVGDDDAFAAGVRVCAPVFRIDGIPGDDPGAPPSAAGSAPMPVSRSVGDRFERRAPGADGRVHLRTAGTWGGLVADLHGVPPTPAAPGGSRLGGFCTATAGFRDQYYGLRGFVFEAGELVGAEELPRLVTSGLVDPARLLWGRRATRFDGRAWQEPVVDLDRLERDAPALAAWAAARLVPKVVVATQTRVLEAAVDVDGTWFPSVPTIALTCDPDRLWEAAAVVLAPSTSAWAMGRHIGAALSADALKVSARQLLDAPLPVDRAAWLDGADELIEAAAATDGETWRAALDRFGALMARAYAAPDEVLTWWRGRLPRWR